MFGLIGHSTSFEDAKRKASLLGFDHIADGDLMFGVQLLLNWLRM